MVTKASVKGFKKVWSILIDSSASVNYVRRFFHEGDQLYADAPQAQKDDTATARISTGTLVTVHKVFVNLGVNFFIILTVVRCSVLDLDLTYDLVSWYGLA